MNISLKKPLVYVARDIERALGTKPVGNYFIISNDTPYGREIQKKYPDNITLVKHTETIDTYELLELDEVQSMIARLGADIVVFQNIPRIERLAAEKKWTLLNPPADLAKKIEEKISQIEWLGDDSSLLPPHEVVLAKDVKFAGKKFVLQFNHAHTGQGTYVIDSEKALESAVEEFPNRECRVTDFIDGSVFTVNCVVAGRKTLVGNISYQITGLSPFTDLPFSTIGNDWSMPRDIKYKKMSADTLAIAVQIGRRLADEGWKGLFGLDIVYDEKTQKTYLIEINARQPASAVFESTLEKDAFPGGESIFESHIKALLGETIDDSEIKPICSGSQIVLRKTHSNILQNVIMSALLKKGFTVIPYENTEHNKELLRIQSGSGIMESPGRFNSLGKFIESCIK